MGRRAKCTSQDEETCLVVRVGSLVHLKSWNHLMLGIILETPNSASIVKVFWMDDIISRYVHIEDIDIIRR